MFFSDFLSEGPVPVTLTPRWRRSCKELIGKYSEDERLRRREESRVGQSFDAASIEASADRIRSFENGCPFRNVPSWGEGARPLSSQADHRFAMG